MTTRLHRQLMESPMARTGVGCLSILCLILAAVMGFATWSRFQQARATATWTETTGLIEKSGIEARTFEEPKGDTPLASAMSIPWVAAGIEPEIKDDGTGGQESDKLLLWVNGCGPEFGKRIKGTATGDLKWVIHGYSGNFEVTHWAYISEPRSPGAAV